MTGAISRIYPFGVAGFVVMLVSAWYAVTSWRRVPAVGEIGTFDPGGVEKPQVSRSKPSRIAAARRRGFMERMEERWRRRREGGPGR